MKRNRIGSLQLFAYTKECIHNTCALRMYAFQNPNKYVAHQSTEKLEMIACLADVSMGAEKSTDLILNHDGE